jgi:hypothetical protein
MDPYSSPQAPLNMQPDGNKPVQISKYLSDGWQLFLANPGLPIAYTVIFVLLRFIPYLGPIAALLLSGPLAAGYYLALRKQISGQPMQFGDYLAGFNNPVPLILVGFLSNVLIGIGTLLLILPGIYLAVSYIFAIPLTADRKMDFWEAMETSRKFVTQQWFVFFVLALVLFVINVVGALLFGIGLLVTIPFSTAVVFAAYRDLFGLADTAP